MGDVFVLNIFLAPVCALVLSLILTPVLIPVLIRLKFGQEIRDIGPSWHRGKSGTPTMGGIAIAVAVLAAVAAGRSGFDYTSYLAVFCAVGFGLIGFADDFIKVWKKRNLGLLAWQKSALQLLVAVVFVFADLGNGLLSTSVIIPFAGYFVDFSWLYIPFAVFFLLSVVNGVNLTDGIDGLACSVTIIILIYFGLAYEQASPITIFCYTVAAATAGFLVFNKNPARVFMGDTGALFLGGAVGAAALIRQNPFILLLVGIIYVIETLSVIIQVISFKLTGKRVFKMSPIHHHFEMSGWSEKRIVFVFSGITLVMAVISLFV